MVNMKRLILAIAILLSCFAGRAQSIGLIDLNNLTSLKSEQIDDYFTAGKIFKLQVGEEQDGVVIKHWLVMNPKAGKTEIVFTGKGFKTAAGDILHNASYQTNDPQNIYNLINQTKGAGLKLTFQGADNKDNIYIYDSFLYHVVFKLSFDQTVGTVDITQKFAFTQ